VFGDRPPAAQTSDPKTKPELFADVEEGISWTMEFPGGVVADGRTSYARSANRFRANAPGGYIEFKRAFLYRDLVVETSRGPLHFDPPVNQQALQMDDFAQCVLHDRASRVGGEMGRRDLKIIEAIYAASKSGRRVLV